MKQLLISYAKRMSSYLQRSDTSFRRHHAQYVEKGKLDIERKTIEEYRERDMANIPELRLNELLSRNPRVRLTAIDIGSGNGWLSAWLSRHFASVIAIEPSAAAIDIAKQLHPREQYPNITWVQGLAEGELANFSYTVPTLFVTSVVFSHLRDEEVERICNLLNTLPHTESVLAFVEAYGHSWHQISWHIRTEEWWRSKLSAWELDFHGPQVPSAQYKLGFHGKKVL